MSPGFLYWQAYSLPLHHLGSRRSKEQSLFPRSSGFLSQMLNLTQKIICLGLWIWACFLVFLCLSFPAYKMVKFLRVSQVALTVKNPPAIAGDIIWDADLILGREDSLEKEKAAHSSALSWRIPWTEQPGGLQSIGSQRVRHDWSNLAQHRVLMGITWDTVYIKYWGQCVDTSSSIVIILLSIYYFYYFLLLLFFSR